MSKEYIIKRKLLKFNKKKGSWFITLPKLWVESEGLKLGDELVLAYNNVLKIIPPKRN